jgi:hypothetical protein
MDEKAQWLRQFDAYPPWLVYTSLALTALVALWIFGKLFKWLLNLVLVFLVVGLIVGAVCWFLG